MLKPIDLKRIGLIKGLEIDNLIKWDSNEWRGTANKGEFFFVIIFKNRLVQVGISEIEYEHREQLKPLLAWKKKKNGKPSIYEILDSLDFVYDLDDVWDISLG